LPTPARAAIEANAGDEWRRGKGEEAAIMESMETCERKPIEAWCKSWPEREAARPREPTAESGTAEPSPYRRAAEASAYHSAAEAAAHHSAAEASAHHPTAEASARHPTAKATTHPAVKAPSMEAATSAHPGIRCRRRCHRAREGDSGQRDYDFAHHGVSPFVIRTYECRSSSLNFIPLSVFCASQPILSAPQMEFVRCLSATAASKDHNDDDIPGSVINNEAKTLKLLMR
jgi:hypothetical protein